jgi:hypothetical protein
VRRVIPGLLATALASAGCSVILGIDEHSLAPGPDSGANASRDAASAVESGRDDAGHDAGDASDANALDDSETDGSGGAGSDAEGDGSSAPLDAGGDSSTPPDAGGDSSTAPDAGGDSNAPPDAAADVGVLATTDHAPTMDAYVRDGPYVTTNFGSDVTLQVKNATGFSRKTWIAFDVSQFTSITAAKLRLFLTSLDNNVPNAVFVTVFSTPASSNAWRELTITWNNQPAVGQQIASISVDTPSVGTWIEWDVTSAVQAEIGGVCTLVIDAQPNSNRGAFFSSREGMAPPVLRITGY